MTRNRRFGLSGLAILLYQIGSVAFSVHFGYAYSRNHKVIPRAVLPLPDFHVSAADALHILYVFCIAHAAVFALLAFRCGANRFDEARRFTTEFLGMLVAFTFSSLYVYLATDISYDPQMMAATGVLLSAIFFATYALFRPRNLRPRRVGVPGAFVEGALGTLGRLFTPAGLLILAFFFTPLVMGKLFYSNRQFADMITHLRVVLSARADSDWVLVNAFGSQKFRQPMLAKQAPGGSGDLYVLEREGRLLRVPYPKGGEPTVLLDIHDKVGPAEIENGTLGFALHPEFGKAGAPHANDVYVYYTAVKDKTQINHLSRFDLGAGSPEAASNSEQSLLALEREASGFHNGGSVEFGPDGYLYVAFGEGLRIPKFKEPGEVLRGAILRIDVNETPGTTHPPAEPPKNGSAGHYTIPNDNPFVGQPGIREEYWALGLRNPYRFTFDPQTKLLWAGDVGSTVWEEVNVVEKGRNYQYPFIEGREKTDVPPPAQIFGEQRGPIYTYEHNAYDRAIIGGFVYRGGQWADLQGKYVFADNYSGKISVMPAVTTEVDKVDVITRANQFAQRGVSSLTQLGDGTVLVTVLGEAGNAAGEVMKLARGAEAVAVAKAEAAANAQTAETPYSAAATASLFTTNCARCHGEGGKGDGPDAAKLPVKLPDFTDPAFHAARSDEALTTVITQGGAAVGRSAMMPPWSMVLQPAEMKHMVRYLRELGGRAAGAKQP
ncbi:MAG: PQQ-dependent sugar dehydrogenase [Gammaproteobacteria bacterium]|nr:PQQ-dependent sugar dehydrogenase [Gammaproteobacteria bacterium]